VDGVEESERAVSGMGPALVYFLGILHDERGSGVIGVRSLRRDADGPFSGRSQEFFVEHISSCKSVLHRSNNRTDPRGPIREFDDHVGARPS